VTAQRHRLLHRAFLSRRSSRHPPTLASHGSRFDLSLGPLSTNLLSSRPLPLVLLVLCSPSNAPTRTKQPQSTRGQGADIVMQSQSDHLQASVFPVVTLVPLTLWHFNGTGVLALRNQQPGQALVVPLVVLNSSGCLDYLTGKKGKNDPNIYVLDRDNMGKFNPNAEGDNIYQLLRGLVCSGGEFGKPSYFNTTVCYGAVGDALKAFRSQMPNWRPRPVRKAQTSFRIQERHPPLTPMALPTALCGRLKTGVLPSCTVTMPRILRPNSHGSLTPLTLAPGWRLA
jgi:hypothetical protein